MGDLGSKAWTPAPETAERHNEELQKLFVDAMRRQAATVCVITCRNAGGRYGMAATAVTSLSLEPPSVLACVNRSSEFYGHLEQAEAFCINILSESQAEQSRVFGSRHHRHERFKSGTWNDHPDGPPMLADAQASLICVCDGTFKYGSHAIVVGRVQQVVLGGATAPLIYLDRKVISATAAPTER